MSSEFPQWMKERIIHYYAESCNEGDQAFVKQILEYPHDIIENHAFTVIFLCMIFSSYDQNRSLETLIQQDDVEHLLDLYAKTIIRHLGEETRSRVDRAYQIAEAQLRLRCPLCKIPNARRTEQDIVCVQCHAKERQHVKLHLRRARIEGLQADLTLDQWLETLVRYEWKCAYCKGPYEVLEHITPLSYGIDGTTIHNCVPGCRSCNASRH